MLPAKSDPLTVEGGLQDERVVVAAIAAERTPQRDAVVGEPAFPVVPGAVALLQMEQGSFDKAPRVWTIAAEQPAGQGGCRDRHDPFHPEQGRLQMLRPFESERDPKIGVIEPDGVVAVGCDHPEIDVGMPTFEVGQAGQEPEVGQRRGDRQTHDVVGPDTSNRLDGVVDLGKGHGKTPVQQPTGGGHGQPSGRALQQLHAERGFQAGHGMARGRLADAQLAGRRGEATGFGDGGEGPEPAVGDGHEEERYRSGSRITYRFS